MAATNVDLTGDEDAVNLVLEDANLLALGIGDDEGNDDSVEEFSISNSGDSVVAILQDADLGDVAQINPTSISVSGSGSLDLRDQDGEDTSYSGLTTVDSTDVALTLDVDNSGSDAGTDTSITSTGADDDIVLVAAGGAADDAAVTTVDLGDGDNTADVTNGDSLQDTTITTGSGADTLTVDLSNATDNSSTAAITAGAGADEVDVTADADVALTADLGDGDDVLTIDTINATDDVTDSIDGGAGTDTLRGTTGNLNTIETDEDQLATLSNFEKLAVTDLVANDIDLTTWGFDALSLEDVHNLAEDRTITMASGATVALDLDAVIDPIDTDEKFVLDVDGASDAGSSDDVVNFEMNADFDGDAEDTVTADVSVGFVETLNLTTTDSLVDEDEDLNGGESFVLNVEDGDRLETITVNAELATTVAEQGGADFTALNNFDASESEGGVTADLSNASQGVVVTGGDGDDVFTGSAFADEISGGAGDDVLVGGAGDDVLVGGDGDDDINAGAGADNIVGGAGADTIDVEEGDNFIQINALADGSAATGAGGTFTGFDTYSNFDADSGDTLVFDSGDNTNGATVDTAIIDNAFVISSDDAATGANDLADDGSDRTDVDSVISFLTDSASYDETASEADLVAVTFAGSDDTAVYVVDNGADTDAAAGEVYLLGIIDTDKNINAADFTIA